MVNKEEAEQIYRRRMAQGLIAWEEFPAGEKALVVGDAPGMAELLQRLGMEVVQATSAAVCSGEAEGPFAVIVMVAEPERVAEPQRLLEASRGLLGPHGRLLLGMNNRLGLRYWCGDADPYSGRSLDSLENYAQVYKTPADTFHGRMYSRREIEQMLTLAGFFHRKLYAVVSDLEHPMLLYAEDYPPKEDLRSRVFPTYNKPEHAFLQEEYLYETLIREGMLPVLCNAFLFDCSLDGTLPDVVQVTSSLDRQPPDAMLTIVREHGGERSVEKRAAFPEGEARLREIAAHHADLRAHGVQTVPDELVDGVYRMPYLSSITGQVYFSRQMRAGREQVLIAADKFRDVILQSSEHVQLPEADDDTGVVLARGYTDMVPINAFMTEKGIQFFDQEFVLENCPAKVILQRMVDFLSLIPGMEQVVPHQEWLARYGLAAHEGRWRKIWQTFYTQLRQLDTMAAVRAAHERSWDVLAANRLRAAYPEPEYQRYFVDIFSGLERKKLVVFGTGNFAQRFMDGYASRYPVALVVDNNPQKQGQSLRGVRIESPEALRNWEPDTFKVLVCVKGYLGIVRQLREMGIEDWACFDPSRDYHLPQGETLAAVPAAAKTVQEEPEQEKKPYHIGYVAGVFDLFHMGHLNLLRRAKEQCDYLIAGVVSDEGVTRFKQVEPFVPEAERLEIVRACRYVDQAELIPLTFGGTRDAWHLYHFDVQFSGSDYAHDAHWLQDREFLRRHGAEMVFFPYTKSTSSTKLKAALNGRLQENK